MYDGVQLRDVDQKKDQHRKLVTFWMVFKVTGQTLAQNLASVPDLDFGAQSVILPLERLKKMM